MDLPGVADAVVRDDKRGLYQTVFASSTDGGATYTPTQFTSSVASPTTGPLVSMNANSFVLQPVDMHPGLYLYRYLPGATTTQLADAKPTGINGGNALPSIAMGRDAAVYLVGEMPSAAGGLALTVGRSTDNGGTFKALPPIPQTSMGTATFSWVAAGAPGHIAVVFYQSATNALDPTTMNAPWSAKLAETYDAGDASPQWTLTTLEPLTHTGGLCANAGCTGDSRYSGDLISVVIDANDHVEATWMDEPTPALKPTIRFARVH